MSRVAQILQTFFCSFTRNLYLSIRLVAYRLLPLGVHLSLRRKWTVDRKLWQKLPNPKLELLPWSCSLLTQNWSCGESPNLDRYISPVSTGVDSRPQMPKRIRLLLGPFELSIECGLQSLIGIPWMVASKRGWILCLTLPTKLTQKNFKVWTKKKPTRFHPDQNSCLHFNFLNVMISIWQHLPGSPFSCVSNMLVQQVDLFFWIRWTWDQHSGPPENRLIPPCSSPAARYSSETQMTEVENLANLLRASMSSLPSSHIPSLLPVVIFRGKALYVLSSSARIVFYLCIYTRWLRPLRWPIPPRRAFCLYSLSTF